MIAPATRADLARVGRNGARSRHGRSLVYIDGVPHDKAQLAKKNGLTLEIVSDRVRELRAHGKPVTLENLTRPRGTKARS